MVNSVNLKASVSFVGDGSTNKFYFGFDYINKQFVKVQVGAESSPLTYLTDYTVDDRSVTLTDTPVVGVAIRVYRETPSDRIVEWADGAFIKAAQMTLENLQQLHLIEEAQDYPILNSLSKYPDGFNFNALGSRIIGVSDPINPQDAVTKHYMESVQDGFVAANTKILNEAKDTLSATQQTQSKAQANEALSKAWATSTESPDNADDTLSSTGKTKSARAWAMQAKEYAGALNLSFILDTLLPVGTVYMTENVNFDPNNAWGVGVWIKTAIDRVLQGTNDRSKVGTTIDAGLPNITGSSISSALGWWRWDQSFSSGALSPKVSVVQNRSPYNQQSSSSEWGDMSVNMDASKSNPIYGSSDTVQPPAELVFIWKRIS